MKEVTILSGKGGTGKTSVAAALCSMMTDTVAVDADVDAANLGLLLPGADGPETGFYAGKKARIDEDTCVACGLCVQHCPFDALTQLGCEEPKVLDIACEGCGVCGLVCVPEAISFVDNRAGEYWTRQTEFGPLVHGELGIAQDNSGKFVAALRKLGKEIAMKRGAKTILVDGPPGIGCPTHAAVTGASTVLVVTEPSQSGLHDLKRLLLLLSHFKIPAHVVVNRASLDDEMTAKICQESMAMGVNVLGSIPYDPMVPIALSRGELPREAAPEVWAALESLTLALEQELHG